MAGNARPTFLLSGLMRRAVMAGMFTAVAGVPARCYQCIHAKKQDQNTRAAAHPVASPRNRITPATRRLIVLGPGAPRR